MVDGDLGPRTCASGPVLLAQLFIEFFFLLRLKHKGLGLGVGICR